MNAPCASSQATLIKTFLAEIRAAYIAAIARHGCFCIALSGGSTPRPFLEAWAQAAGFDWDKIAIYSVDERCVAADAAASNQRLIKKALHEVALSLYPMDALAPDGAAAYEALIRADNRLIGRETSFPQFDCILLGMGADGHTASLFPNQPSLDEATHAVIAVEPVATSIPQVARLTLTLPVINAAHQRILIFSGVDKHTRYATISKPTRDFPVSLLAPTTVLCHL